MHYSEWASRWEQNRIGFHVPEVNPRLIRYAEVLLTPRPERILVPLCGKSLDLLWLMERADEVVGVELIPKAIHDFFAEHHLEATEEDAGPLKRHRYQNLCIYEGDMMDLTPEVAGTFDAIYDRAALIALDPDERATYRPHLLEFLRPEGHMLLITLDYLPRTGGPPYSVSEDEVQEFLTPHGVLEEVEHYDAFEESANLRQRGVTQIYENAYRFIKHPLPQEG